MKVLANQAGKSNPKIPKTQAVYPATVSFKMYESGVKVNNFPPIVISKFGKVFKVEQSGQAGMFPYKALTTAVGPTMAEVPVSTIPLNPESKVKFPKVILSNPIIQQVSLTNG